MKSTLKRRDFLIKSCQAGITCCAIAYSTKVNGMMSFLDPKDEKPDPEKLNYCGYKCTQDCKLLKATIDNNTDLKKEVYKEWKFKEKYGIDFEQDKIFCWGCKLKDKPLGISVSNCTVRKCAISKKFECCIECKELESCKKELWDNFPDFKKVVIEMQKKYQNT